jgi:hypothetical protein
MELACEDYDIVLWVSRAIPGEPGRVSRCAAMVLPAIASRLRFGVKSGMCVNVRVSLQDSQVEAAHRTAQIRTGRAPPNV